MLQVCVLNLKRRSDRREKFQQLNRQSDIQFVWVEAIEGRELDISKLVEQGLLFRQYEHFTPGQLGCAMSHRMLWQKCVEKDTPLIIFEDDAVLRQDFAAGFTHIYQQLPATWDCVLLGYNFDSILDIEIMPGVNLQGSFSPPGFSQANQQAFVATTVMPSLLPLNNVFGVSAYAISPKGAQQLMNLCFPLTASAVAIPALKQILLPTSNVDGFMNIHYRRLRAFCIVPPLVINPNSVEDSDSQVR